MKHTITKFTLLLAVLAAGNSAWAQAQVLTVPPGVPYTFSSDTAAGGGGTITYQWYRDGVAIAGATDSSYTVTADLAYGKNVEFKRGAVSSSCPHSISYANAFIITFCGLLLNDLCWAHTNVAQPRTFADKPDMYTEFYQWNRLTAWSATAPTVSGWNATADTSKTWTVNPCPAGWRLPTVQEFQALDLLSDGNGNNNPPFGGTWVAAYTRGNEVAGRFYGPNHALCTFVAGGSMDGCIFLPAIGWRDNSGSLNSLRGRYWSSSHHIVGTASEGYRLDFSYNNNAPNSVDSNNKADGYPIRCVQ